MSTVYLKVWFIFEEETGLFSEPIKTTINGIVVGSSGHVIDHLTIRTTDGNFYDIRTSSIIKSQFVEISPENNPLGNKEYDS